MTREEKINVLLALLAPIICEWQDENYDGPAPQVAFLSANEVQIEEFPGKHLPVNKKFDSNVLRNVLNDIVQYNISEEAKDWECCVQEQYEESEYEVIDGDVKYDEALVPAHVYHSIRFCAELIGEQTE